MDDVREQNVTASDRAFRVALALAVGGGLLTLAWPGQPIMRAAAGTSPRIEDRLDPNQATWWQLERLPGVGESLAKSIVAERERRAAQWPGETAFVRPDSLLHVPGLGPRKLAPLLAYLRFPPASAPAEGASRPVDTTPLRP